MEFINKEEEKRLIAAIKSAELGSSAEIKVHIDKYCKGNPLDEAVRWFLKLKMEQTKDRNGVLIYVAYKDKKVAIIGDKGINALIGETFWDSTYHLMREQFKKGNICEGLCDAIGNVSKKLKQFFPYATDDVNELSDDISYGN
ncbi:MAG: TPM domain-containing protein [Rikenellaceae bacterium]